MDRRDTLRLSADIPFLADPAGQTLCAMFEDAGHRAYFVGGCVRNAVMGYPPSDVDIATTAAPQAVMDLAKVANLRAIPTGFDHGTVTVVVDGTPFEVTTFRRDVATDGRRAVVAFSQDMAQDAARRDFTLNALYADRRGVVYDPMNGLQDAREGRVRFIDDPGQRIREDYLRILRFFRFSAFYERHGHGFDPDALAAVAENLDGLETLSAERVGSEMMRLLSAPDPVRHIAVMERIGVMSRILPGSTTELIGPLVHCEAQISAPHDPVTRLAALGGTDVVQRLRLSRKHQRQLDLTLRYAGSLMGARATGQMAGVPAGSGVILLRAAMTKQPPKGFVLQDIERGAAMKFPVSARDLPQLSGPELGNRLDAIKKEWLASDLTKTKADLLGA